MSDAEQPQPASGWRLVPVEPTRGMWEAGAAQCIRAEDDGRYTAIGLAVDVYRAMLAAAPPPPAAAPITQDAILDEFCRTPGLRQHVQAFEAGVRFAERVLAAAAKERGQ